MKILFSHGGMIKLFQIEKESPDNYLNMRRFVEKNLTKVPPNFVVKYKDQEGDLIVIESNKDFDTLFDRKSTDYIRASIEEEEQNKQESEQSEDDSADQKQQILDDRLKSDDQEEKEVQQEPFGKLRNHLILNSKAETHTCQRFSELVETPQSVKLSKNNTSETLIPPFENHPPEPKTCKTNDTKPESNYKKNSQIQFSKTLPLKTQAPKLKENQKQESEKEDEDETEVFPPQVSKSRLASRLSSQMNDQHVLRLVRSLFNTQFEQRLEALIPTFMEKIKKQVRVEFPDLLPPLPQLEQIQQQVVEHIEESKPKTLHEVCCNGCTRQTIEGIRYKCISCPQFNLCEDCERVIEHEHNLIKMKFPEVKEIVEEQIIDPKLEFTNKCFFLASFFGGEAYDYKNFVQKHSDKTQLQIFDEYFKVNGKKLRKRMGKRLNEMTKKLGFYFEKDYLDFIDLVLQNPTQSFQSLINYVKDCGIESEDSQEEKSYSSKLNISKSLKESSKQSLKQSRSQSEINQHLDSRKTEKIEKHKSKPISQENNQREEFLYYVYSKYGIQPQKELKRSRFAIDYYNKNEKFMSLEQMKAQFCEEVQKSKQWKPTEYYDLI